MLAYYILVFVPLIYLSVGYSFPSIDKKKPDRYSTAIFFIIYFLLLALRSEVVGTDTSSYVNMFYEMRSISFTNAVNYTGSEQGYYFITKVISMFTSNPQIFIAIISLIVVAPIGWFYVKNVENVPIAMVLFLLMPDFLMFFSGFRQSVAIAVGIFSYFFTKKKKPILFILTVFLAMLFHSSSVVLFLMYPMYHLKIESKNAWLAIPVIGVMYVFNQQIFMFVLQFMDDKYGERYGDFEGSGAMTMLILFVLFALYAFVAVDEDKLNEEDRGLRNLLLVSVCFQLFVPLNNIAMRMNYYYLIFLPICMSKMVNRYRKCDSKIVEYIVAGLCLFFYFYYLRKAGNAVGTTQSLEVYPYIPFWQQTF